MAAQTSTRTMMVIPPTLIKHEDDVIEVALHRPNASMKRELDLFLRGAMGEGSNGMLQSSADVLIITTCQESKVELLQWDEAAAAEKDRLLFVFNRFARDLCGKLKAQGYWADYADPASGLLANSSGQVIWPEVQALERLRGFQKTKAGPCHILLHPQWGSKLYPATIFTNAPESELRSTLGLS